MSDANVKQATGPSVKQIAVVVVILAVAIIVTALTSDVTKALEPGIRLVNGQPYLPESVGEWRGDELQGLTPDERQVLPADTEGARRRYRTSDGRELACSVVLAGRDVTSIHRPELCLPGQGWQIERAVTEAVPTANVPGGVLSVMCMDAVRVATPPGGQRGTWRALFVYWFIGKDRITPHHWERILWTAKDRVLHNRNHRWAYVLILVPEGAEQPGVDMARARAEALRQVADFVPGLYAALKAD